MFLAITDDPTAVAAYVYVLQMLTQIKICSESAENNGTIATSATNQ